MSIFSGALAERMGFEDDCFRETVDSTDSIAHWISSDPRMKGITRERLENEHRIRLNLGQPSATKADDKNREDLAAVNRCATQTPIPFLPFAEGNFPTSAAKPSSTTQR